MNSSTPPPPFSSFLDLPGFQKKPIHAPSSCLLEATVVSTIDGGRGHVKSGPPFDFFSTKLKDQALAVTFGLLTGTIGVHASTSAAVHDLSRVKTRGDPFYPLLFRYPSRRMASDDRNRRQVEQNGVGGQL
ncbi:hypothetical protein E1A91_A04G178800v1 [Gossypium mustelinum]|uniref:Uncharacterized protein n=1 Tax=Gossypium mustelinum TaxID=34275 RepID=A0A5D2ZQB7_GOSMU|nr:hypothetical protein E1A91_A04G178800v1 [Gossypium mustelinum]